MARTQQANPAKTKIATALAIAETKLGSGAAHKYNAIKAVSTLKWQTEKMYVMQLIQRSDYLAQAILENPISLMTALQDAANLGLSLSPSLGHVYLIPQRPKAGDPLEVTAKVSYKGMEQVVLTSGTVLSITTELVYANDTFRFGTNIDGPFLEFVMNRGERGELEGGFCLAKYQNGEHHIEWMTAADIKGCKEAATRAQNGKVPAVWVGAFANEQRKKCVVRRAAKHWPATPVLEKMIAKFDVDNPMDFDKANVIDGQSTVLLNDDQVQEIRAALTELTDDDAAVWMQLAAKARGFDGVREVPVDHFDELKESLVKRMHLMIDRKAAQAKAKEDKA